jgi:carboxyl-terminal processing protease
MKADDVIVAIDGEPIAGLETRDIVRRLRGPIGAAVAVTVARAGAIAPLSLTLTRALIIPPSISYRREGGIAVVKLMQFNQRTTEALHEALRRAEQEIGADLAGVVLDMRGNLGGLLDQAISVADTFLPEGQIVSTRGRHRSSGQTSYAGRGDLGERLPLVVLVNGASASASEIVAAALQDNGRAVIVGTATFGKGSVQTVIPMPNEGELILTWARFHAPSGYPIADLGVMPTVCTSGSQSAETYLAAVRDGRVTPAATVADWRAADHSNNARLKELRNLCAPETKERDTDLEIARALLDDRALYARTLQQATLTAKAMPR